MIAVGLVEELQYYIEGEGRMTVCASDTNAHIFDYQGGDVGYVPKGTPHYIENTRTTRLCYFELWQSDHFADVSLAAWLAFTPWELVKAHLNMSALPLLALALKPFDGGTLELLEFFGGLPS